MTSPFSIKNLDLLLLSKERADFFTEPELKQLFVNEYVSKLEDYYPIVLHQLHRNDIAKQIKKEFYNCLPLILKAKYINIKQKLLKLVVAIIPFGFEIRSYYTNRGRKNSI